MAEVPDVVAATGQGLDQEHAAILRANPIVALRVLGHSVGAAYRLAVVVGGDGGATAVLSDDIDTAVLITEEEQFPLLVVVHGTYLVVQRRCRLRCYQRFGNRVLLYFQLVQSPSAC